jgi:hypothetical protein
MEATVLDPSPPLEFISGPLCSLSTAFYLLELMALF